MDQSVDVVTWVQASPLCTDGFKAALKKMVEDAQKEDPEMGLDADPLFNAQDYPPKGWELKSIDAKTGYLVVQGKEIPDFKLTMKVVEVNGEWLVDGCGMVNIPVDMQ